MTQVLALGTARMVGPVEVGSVVVTMAQGLNVAAPVLPAGCAAFVSAGLLPHAGGSASFYRPWSAQLPATVEHVAVQYPGRVLTETQRRYAIPIVTRRALKDIRINDITLPAGTELLYSP